MTLIQTSDIRVSKWYFGGLASAGAACCTHPLDLLKVHLQTTTPKTVTGTVTGSVPKNLGLIANTMVIVRTQGVLALYNGLTASLLRQLTYSTTRFGIYEVVKDKLTNKQGEQVPLLHRILIAGASGAAGGFIGTPADMINVRMQNDIKLPPDQRRNYKHAIDGLIKVYKHEGIKALFNGTTMATTRAVTMTIGQLSSYDQFKHLLMTNAPNVFGDNMLTHFTASTLSGGVATTLTQPLDVLKTRLMNARPNEYKSIGDCIQQLFRQSGPIGFFKGYVPAFIRLAPQTILTFIFFEQLRIRFGKIKTYSTD